MHTKIPVDINWLPIQALSPINGENKADTETRINQSKTPIVRVCAIDGDALIIVSKDWITEWDGTIMPQWLPEYLHIPIWWSVYCIDANINFSPCI
jgi:hypothetical protein